MCTRQTQLDTTPRSRWDCLSLVNLYEEIFLVVKIFPGNMHVHVPVCLLYNWYRFQ